MRHMAALAASRTTLGRSKGRAVSSSLKAENSALKATPTTSKTPTTPLFPLSKKSPAPSTNNNFIPFADRDNTLPASQYWNRYGAPPLGSNMWLECWNLGFLREGVTEKRQEQERKEREERDEILEKQLREEALEDFQLTLG